MGEGNGDGKIVQEGGGEVETVTRLYDSSEKCVVAEIIPAAPQRHPKELHRPGIVGRREIWAVGGGTLHN